MSYYKIIDGVRYSRDLLEDAVNFTKGRGESRISFDEIQTIYQLALDGRGITDVERRTLQYIARQFTLTDKARAWLAEQIGTVTGENLDTLISQVLRQEYGLKNIQWQIDAADVTLYESSVPTRMFGAALRASIDAFLHWSQGVLSFVGMVSRRDLAFDDVSNPEALLKGYLDRGTLYLVPMNPAQRENLPYDLPDFVDQENFWVFVLDIPDFYPAHFIAYVHRNQTFQYSKGYFSRKIDKTELISRVVRQYAALHRLKTVIDLAEVQRQMDLLPGQNFGNALYSAVASAIYNGESSFSFRDFIGQEIWQDPDRDRRSYMFEYINTGTLHLIPLDYRAQTDAGTATFPVPEEFSLWTGGDWAFGLEMPKKTHVKFLITTPRENNEGDSGWNDGFIGETLGFEERLGQVVDLEFKLSGLQLNIPEAEAKAQQQQYWPQWRNIPGVLRQALNTILDDYLSPQSVFHIVANVYAEDIGSESFDDPFEYRNAIEHMIRVHLKSGILNLIGAGSEDVPPNGEQLEQNWLFTLSLPTLSDHLYFVVVPRMPDEEGPLPYCYGVN